MLKCLCRLFGHQADSYERIEWIPSFHADPLEKVLGHCRCDRCHVTWEEVVYDGVEIDADLRRIEIETEI